MTTDSNSPSKTERETDPDQSDESSIPVSEVEDIVDDMRKTATNGMFQAQRRTAQRYVDKFEELIEDHTDQE